MINPHDTATFTSLYNEYFNQVYAYAREGGGADAFDIVHDVFFYLYQHEHVFESREKVRNYLITAVRNRCINRNNTTKNLVEATEELHDIEDERTEIEGVFMDKLMKMLDQLPNETKKVLELRYLKGLGIRKTSIVLGISQNTVRSATAYGVNKMRSWDGSYKVPKKRVQRAEALKIVREIVDKIGEEEFTKITGDKKFVSQLYGKALWNVTTKRILQNIERYNLKTNSSTTK